MNLTERASPESPPDGIASHLMMGFAAPWRGAVYLFRNRALWPYAAFPLLLGLAWSSLLLLQFAVNPAGGGWLIAALAFLFNIAVAAAAFMIQVFIALSAPLLDWLSEQTEETLGTLPRGKPFWAELVSPAFWLRAVKALIEALKLLVFKVIVGAIGLLLGFIPAAGPFISVALAGVVTGVDFLDYPLARRDWSLRQKLELAKQYWAASLAFGLEVFAFLSIPGVGGIMLAPCIVGGTLLVRDLGVLLPVEESADAPSAPTNQDPAT